MQSLKSQKLRYNHLAKSAPSNHLNLPIIRLLFVRLFFYKTTMSLINSLYFPAILLLISCSVSAENTTNEAVITQEATPVVQVSPTYPFSALILRETGWVKMKMTITNQGNVENILVVDNHPRRVFDLAAVQAMSKFKFKPRHINGKPVAIEATQTIEFTLPDEVIDFEWDTTLIERLRQPIDALPIVSVKVILADSIKIESTIQPKEVVAWDFFFTDEPNQLNSEPVFWRDLGQDFEHIEDGSQQLTAAKQLVENQYKNHPNLFKRHHRIYHASHHPPTLLNGVNTKLPNGLEPQTTHRLKLTVDANGTVVNWESLNPDKGTQKNAQKWISQLQFRPAIVNHQLAEDSITLTFNTITVSRLSLVAEMMLRNKQMALSIPWVKVAALIDSKGRVEETKVLVSSNQQFEALAVKRLKNYHFKNTKQKRQIIQLIEFEPSNASGQAD